jgi:membrane-bound metal-dependent hydrolase YbcI (DUF457 family)
MFIGHFAVGLAAKRAAPAVSLGTFILSCQLADLVWPTLVLIGVEHVSVVPGATVVTPLLFESYPYSHSLLALLGWGALVAVVYRIARPRTPLTTLLLLAGVVVSHWVLDVATHRPDVPIAPGLDTKIGFELWRSLPATMIVEGVMFVAGIALYLSATRARDRTGTYAFWGLIAFLVLTNVGNMFGPPPPSAVVVAWSAQALWLLVAWGYWIDRHRTAA